MSGIHMSTLKAWQLKYWAYLTGVASTGTKAELQSALRNNSGVHSASKFDKPQKIVSVDMGIRNLAFCALEVPPIGQLSGMRPLKVTTWKRMDLLDTSTVCSGAVNALAEIEQPETGKTKARKTKKQRDLASAIAKKAFTPFSLSKTAYGITTELLSLKPSTVLIERQRFRSGGASTILEWTIRVNMLESMLWACLETLRASRYTSESPDVRAVNPARVAHFWADSLAGVPLLPFEGLFMPHSQVAATISEAVGRKGKVDKKAKIAIVKSWLAQESEDIFLTFEGQAAEISEAFKQARGGHLVAGGKLDDLADCLLQAVAWARWEENRKAIDRLWQDLGGVMETNYR